MRATTKTNSKIRELRETAKRAQEVISKSPTSRAILESALRAAGVDENLLVKTLGELLEATRPWWNPKKQAFDLLPDYRVRIAALRLAFRIHGCFRAKREDYEVPQVINFSDDTEAQSSAA